MSGRPWQGDVPRGHRSGHYYGTCSKMTWHIISRVKRTFHYTPMYTTGPVFSKVRDAREKEGRQAYTWYKDNYLLASKDKFQAMVMNPRNVETNSASLDVIIEDHAIANMDHIQLLGVTIDKDINFSKHIGEVCTKAGRKVGVLTRRLRNMISCSAKLSIYTSHQSCRSWPTATRSGTSVRPPIPERSSEFKKEQWGLSI